MYQKLKTCLFILFFLFLFLTSSSPMNDSRFHCVHLSNGYFLASSIITNLTEVIYGHHFHLTTPFESQLFSDRPHRRFLFFLKKTREEVFATLPTCQSWSSFFPSSGPSAICNLPSVTCICAYLGVVCPFTFWHLDLARHPVPSPTFPSRQSQSQSQSQSHLGLALVPFSQKKKKKSKPHP